MASYKLRIKKSAAKELEAVSSKAERRRIVTRIRALAENPRPCGCKKLSGNNLYRIHQGRWRILYVIEDNELVVYVIRIADRKQAYRNV